MLTRANMFLIILALNIVLIHGRIMRGACPTFNNFSTTNVDLSLMLGEWYKYGELYTSCEAFPRCSIFNFTPLGNGVYNLNITNEITNDRTRGQYQFQMSAFKPANTVNQIRFVYVPSFNLENSCDVLRFNSMNYQILTVNYTNYMLLYGCAPELFGFFNLEISWMLVRKGSSLEEAGTAFNQTLSTVFNETIINEYRRTLDCITI